MNRTTILKSGWKFHLGDEEYAFYKGFDDSGWQSVTLPHDWSMEHPFDRRYSSGTGYVRGGVGWYRLRFILPEEIRGKTVLVTFGGVYKNARVWCNTNYLGMRPFGYATFTHDISAFVQPGDNVIAVRAEHTDLADSRWFTGSGIYRDVTLTVLDPVHFAQDGVFVYTTAANAEEAELLVEWRLSESADVTFELRGSSGQPVTGADSSGEAGTVSLRVSRPALWSPDSPALYSLICRASENGVVRDELTIPCGIRTFAFDADTGFTLNNVPTRLKGVCLHHDAGALGAAVPKAVWRRRLQKLKETGCNAIRAAHNPPDSHLLDLCDELGFLVMDEAFDEWEGFKNKWWQGHNVYPPKHFGYADAFPQWYERDLSGMVLRDRNHPSVILWSIGNEVDYPNDPYCHPLFESMTGNNDANKPAQERQYDPNKPNAERLAEIARWLAEIVKKHDVTRPVTAALAFPELSNLIGYAQALDIAGYNYKEHLYREDRAKYPGRVIYGSENGHGESEWLAVRDNADICGQFLWTGIDYLGEAHGWPVRLSPAGLLTTAGFEKPRFCHRRAMWTRELMCRLSARVQDDSPELFAWDFEPGQTVCVSVYANAERAELLLNGRSLGVQDTDGFAVSFDVPFEPGELKAVVSRGAESAEDILATPGGLAEIRLQIFDAGAADANDVTQVEVSLFDAEGRQITARDAELRFALAGSGELIGIDNGRPDDLTPYTSQTRGTYMGRAIAYVRPGDEGAELHVSARGGVKASICL
ncbi:MAG: DUF4982 domain-containing protein [Oscillospiraceae bacterium]|nr:DUF4982 domain-containing protein [Oscillospiraceae bacterium]